MRRRRWPIAAALVLVLVLVLVAIATVVDLGVDRRAAPITEPATVQVGATSTGRRMPEGFVGLSLEYRAILAYLGRDAGSVDPVFLQLVSALAPGGSPVLRIGGDSTDHTWSSIPGVLESAGIDDTLSPTWLASLHAAATWLGARLILGVNLAAENPTLTGVEARTLLAGVGRRNVEALEVGNEPDAYTAFDWYRTRTGLTAFARSQGWSEPAYARQLRAWTSALPTVPLAGPADAYPAWMTDLTRLLATTPRLDVVTFHRYPLRGCGPEAVGPLAPTVTNLLAPSASAGLAGGVAPFVRVAHRAGRLFRVDELNSASCGGRRGLSDTFASALWILDSLFDMAAVGVDGVNIHTFPGAAYAPFRLVRTGGQWHATVTPLYYGMLMFTRAFPPGARLLRLRAHTNSHVRVWATRGSGGTVRTVVIDEHAAAAALSLRLPTRATHLSVELLRAPSLHSRHGVSLGGASFATGTTTGTLGPGHASTVSAAAPGRFTLTVPADSAVLLTAH